MNYKIIYTPVNNQKYYPKRSKTMLWKYGLVFALLIGVIVITNMTPARAVFMRLLIPGDPEVTQQAFENLLLQMRGGVAFGEAVTTFCREIIHGG